MKQKNVLILYTDQLRRDVLGCYGGTEVTTPHIDSIAQDGVVLDECYTPSAVCTPSRGCFMTGLYPSQNGAYKNGLAVHKDVHGFAEAFQQAGYFTGYLGKWHLSDHCQMGESLTDCNRLGFAHWPYPVEFGHCKSVEMVDGKVVPKRSVGQGNTYTTDWLAEETIHFLDNREKDKPFLMMVSIPDPHQPFEVRHPYDTMFDPLEMQIPESFRQKELPDWAEQDTWGRHHYFPIGMFDREGHLRRLKAQYLGAVKCIDDNVGKILAHLKETGLWEDTIVIFTTDHGEYMGEHGLMEKNNLYESVYHLPMVMHLPGFGKVNARSQTFFNVVDFGATLAGLTSISYPFPVHGEDKSQALLGEIQETERELYIHPSDVPRAGIITSRYELAYVGTSFDKQKEFHEHILFDLKEDPYQLHNLYDQPEYKQVIQELTEKIRLHHITYHTPPESLPKEVVEQEL